MTTSKAARELHTENVVLGAGEIFVDVYQDGAATGGERYLGDSPGATISITTERTTVQSSDGAVARDLIDRIRSISRTMGFTLQDASIDNWALFLVGTTDEATINPVAADAAVGVATALLPSKSWAPILDASGEEIGPIKLKGSPNIAGDAVTKGAGSGAPADAAAAGVDYEFDEKTGRIYNKLGAATKFLVKMGTTAGRKVKKANVSASATETICAIRYVEDSVAGVEGRNVFIRRANLVPAGEAALKSRDTPQQFAFTATVLDPGEAKPAMTINGVEK